MSTIVYRKSNALNPDILIELVQQSGVPNDIDLKSLTGDFRMIDGFPTQSFASWIGYGAHEPKHHDGPMYQALVILEPGSWVLKGPRDSHKVVFQEAGDLVILDPSRRHEVVWNRHHPKPYKPWVYLFVDADRRTHWSKRVMTKEQAIERSLMAVEEMNERGRWLN